MKKFMRCWTVMLFAGLLSIPLLMAEGVDPAVKIQVLGVLGLAIPFAMGLVKKIKMPAWLVPFVPPLIGALVEAGLVLGKLSDLDMPAAILIGLGVGGVASSGYDCHKKIKEEWKKSR